MQYYQTSSINVAKKNIFVNQKRDGLNGDETPFEINRLYDQVKEDVENPQKEPVIIIGTAGTESGLDDKVQFYPFDLL